MAKHIEELRELEAKSIIKEALPHPNYWRFDVIHEERLPEDLQLEYVKYGELQWYGEGE